MAKRKEIILAQDGDIISYVVGFACEKSFVEFKNKETGHTLQLNNRSELWNLFKGVMSKKEINEAFEITDIQIPEPLENALNTVNKYIEASMKACGATKVEVWLSGKSNFRDLIPLPKIYKHNRRNVKKPILLPEIQNYLITKYNAKITDGYEADDKLSMRAYEATQSKDFRVIQGTIDKDARQCLGELFNRDKMVKPEKIKGFGSLYLDDKNEVRGEGRIWLYFQTLFGDTTDGYNPRDLGGIKGYGEKAAFKDLEHCTNDSEALQVIHDKYKEWYPEPVTYTAHDGKEYTKNYVQILQMYFDCARMLRWEGDEVNIVDLFKKFKVKSGRKKKARNS